MGAWSRAWAGSPSALVLGAALGLGACATLWGLDDLQYDRPTGPTTSAGGAAGAAGAAGGGGQGGGGGAWTQLCPGTECPSCAVSSCAQQACSALVSQCIGNAACVALETCMTGCEPADHACAFTCVHANLQGVDAFYAAFECLGCSPETCADACAVQCLGCSAGLSCQDCVAQPCLADACAQPYDACGAEPECMLFQDCYYTCSDQACLDACATQYQAGAPLFYDVMMCALCTKAACYDDCSAEGPFCTAAQFPV